MAAETNTILTSDLARVREIDFVSQFNSSVNAIAELLGTTRRIAAQDGTLLKALKVTGTLGNGVVAEGELIPLSKYETEYVAAGEITLKKWRKGTTAEAILKGGYDQAVGATTDAMVRDIQKGIRSDFVGFLATGTGTASGANLQRTLANVWGQLQILWEDDAVETVYFVNPMDAAEYLGNANITMQTAFGMSYVENFMGLGRVFLSAAVPEGKVYATAAENVVLYYVDVATSALGNAFNLTSDELGLVGITEYPDNDTARVMDLVMSGVTFFPERIDGIVVGSIAGE